MAYILDNLGSDEAVVHTTKLHWIIFMPAIMWAIVSSLILIPALHWPDVRMLLYMISGVTLLFAGVCGVRAWWHQFTTEIAVTNHRIIYKRGFIRRHTMEMALPNVETVYVDQSVLGRLLGYGSVHALGTGESLEALDVVDNPVGLRNSIVTH
jgi:uncharacterized membrane protein YdbT with pleckstrin-like domain